jgi:hypothetical protein
MLLPQSTCNYCSDHSAFVLDYLDDAAGMPVCRLHLADGYDFAEKANAALSFLPVHISRVGELVAA